MKFNVPTECEICGSYRECARHEVFFGEKHRALSIKWGMTVMLCPACHNSSNYAVHNNIGADTALKQKYQKIFEEKHGHEKFMQVFGRNYL